MAIFYKGVGVGTFLHGTDLRVNGLVPRRPGAAYSVNAIIQHIARGTSYSPCVSLTRSYGVAEMYALDGRARPTQRRPAYVYQLDIPDPSPVPLLVKDPIHEIAAANSNPLAPKSYHHDGDMTFVLGVVDPVTLGAHLTVPVRVPRGLTATAGVQPTLSIELEAMVRALRDAEILVVGIIPASLFVNRFDVY